jgi:hypothetical protein
MTLLLREAGMTFTSIDIATGSSSFSACDVKRAHRLGRRHRTARDTSVGYLDDGTMEDLERGTRSSRSNPQRATECHGPDPAKPWMSQPTVTF